MLAIGRAVLMARPRILMLDEPSLGLALIIVQEIFRIIAVITASVPPCSSWSRTRARRSAGPPRLNVLENGRIALVGQRRRAPRVTTCAG